MFRPILKPVRSFDNDFMEAIPEDVLPVDLFHRAVRRLFESENGQPAAAPSVRVINLSVCDRARPFDRKISPWARLLDWLAWEYKVLFIVSAGNHPNEIELDLPRDHLVATSPADLQNAVIKAVAADARHRRLLSPAETVNGLTIGSSHQDSSTVGANRFIDPMAHTGRRKCPQCSRPGIQKVHQT